MQYRELGKTGLTVSTIGFGAWAIGGMNWGPTDDQVSLAAIRTAIEQGVNFFDTADVYGFGHSEELLAKVLADYPGEDIIVATKAGNDFYHATSRDDTGYGPIRQNTAKEYLIWAAEQSLKRLKRDTLDILQLHSPDTALLECDAPWEALQELKRSGKIRFAGWSIQSFRETEQAFLLEQYHEVLDTIQVRYNLLEREAEKVLFPLALKYQVGVIVRIPLLFGLLTGKFTPASRFGADDHRRLNLAPEKLNAYLQRWAQLQPLRERYPNSSPAQVSLRFCITHPACHVTIPGAKTPQQVLENSAASDLGPLTKEDLSLIDGV